MIKKFNLFESEEENWDDDEPIKRGDRVELKDPHMSYYRITPHWGDYGEDGWMNHPYLEIGSDLGEVWEITERGNEDCIRVKEGLFKRSCVRKSKKHINESNTEEYEDWKYREYTDFKKYLYEIFDHFEELEVNDDYLLINTINSFFKGKYVKFTPNFHNDNLNGETIEGRVKEIKFREKGSKNIFNGNLYDLYNLHMYFVILNNTYDLNLTYEVNLDKPIKIKSNRIFSEQDPLGEENWDITETNHYDVDPLGEENWGDEDLISILKQADPKKIIFHDKIVVLSGGRKLDIDEYEYHENWNIYTVRRWEKLYYVFVYLKNEETKRIDMTQEEAKDVYLLMQYLYDHR
jgi:hypothetical protein